MTWRTRLEGACVWAAALIFAMLLLREWARVDSLRRAGIGIPTLTGRVAISADPIRYGRRYHGTTSGGGGPVVIEMRFLTPLGSTVRARLYFSDGQTSRVWSGTYQSDSHLLALRGQDGKELSLTYGNDKTWLGTIRLRPDSLASLRLSGF